LGRSSIKYIDASSRQKKIKLQPAGSSVVYGSFPKYVYASSPIEKINKFLCFVLVILAAIALASYYYVFDAERTMNSIGRDIASLANENIELQNKLDNLHSFNRVDAFIKNNSTLGTAEKIVEIPAVVSANAPLKDPPSSRYIWSLGY